MRTPQVIVKGRLGVALTGAAALLLASTGVVVGGGAAQAQGSGFINVITGMQHAVSGGGWSGDTSVAVALEGTSVGTAQVQNGMFSFDLGSTPAVGDVVAATGLDSGHTKTVVVPELRTTRFDVPAGQVSGLGAPASTGWSNVQVNVGNQWTGPTAPAYGVVDEGTGVWTADVGVSAYDFRAGSLGSAASQTDADGDQVTYGIPVPNPTVDVKDSHGVMLHGWTPGSTVTITLYNPGTDTSYTYQATVEANGEWWDVPAVSPWDVIKPGWRASATGPVDMRETPEVTKSIVVPKPFPVPEFAGFSISDTVVGSLTTTTVGAGSMVNVSATCSASDMAWRQAMTNGSGYFSMDFSQPPAPNTGNGTCASEPVSVGYAISDLDGDQFHANWQANPEPSVTADSPLWDGQQFKVAGTGFDLMMVLLRQCELLGDNAVRCDPTTELVINANPGPDWPLGGAAFEIYDYTAKQYLEFEGGGVVDCAAVTCAVLVVSPLRQDVGALAPLTYHQAVQLDLTASAKGTVSTVTGAATVTGSVTASEPTWVHLYGSLVQRFGRTRVVRGEFDTWVEVGEAGATTPWTVQVSPYTGQAFGSGFAELTVSADLGDEGPSWAQTTQIVKVSATKVARR